MKIGTSFAEAARVYAARVRAFKPNARLYLLSVVITGAAMGVFRLLFNFYVLSLGYDEALLGSLITVSSLAALLAALPMGYLADIIGRKKSLIISGVLISVPIIVMVFWRSEAVFYAMNIVSGLGQALAAVTMSPFLMENSDVEERTYLFSLSFGLQTAIASVGNWIGGYLPTWIASTSGVSPTSSAAYAGALLVVGIVAALGVIPFAFIHTPVLKHSERTVFAPFKYFSSHPVLLTKLILPMFLTSLGAGLIMPFMNVFYRQVYHQPDPMIGMLFAWGSLAMGIGLLIAPPLADRFGKIQLVVVSQGISIPFLVIMGFSPVFWLSAIAYYVRLALMNMSGPVYETFVMEHVEPTARATVASLVSMSWNFGWAFSPIISGWLQLNYGFGLPFLGTICLYTISVFMYWAFFWRNAKKPASAMLPVEQ